MQTIISPHNNEEMHIERWQRSHLIFTCSLIICYIFSAGNMSTIVQHVRVPIIPNEVCNEMYGALSDKVKLHISEDMMCAGYKEGGRDACQVSDGAAE